jgi:hypothetical protein
VAALVLAAVLLVGIAAFSDPHPDADDFVGNSISG